MISPDLQAKIALWRQKAIEGTLSEEEMAQAVVALRGGRVGAQIASTTSKAKKAGAIIPNADDLLGELGDM